MSVEALILGLFLAAVAAFGFAKQNGHDLLQHPMRKAIVRFLRRRPGTNITEMCRSLGTNRGTAYHHVYLLEKSDLVESVSQGRERRMFVKGQHEGSRRKICLVQRDHSKRLLRAVLEKPGIIQKELGRRVSMTRKILRRYVDMLSNEGLLKEVTRSRTRRYYPTEELRQVLALIEASHHTALDDAVLRPGEGPQEAPAPR